MQRQLCEVFRLAVEQTPENAAGQLYGETDFRKTFVRSDRMADRHVRTVCPRSWLRRGTIHRMPVEDRSRGFFVRLFIGSGCECAQQRSLRAPVLVSGGLAKNSTATRRIRQGHVPGSAATYAVAARMLPLLGRDGSPGRGTGRRRVRENSRGTAPVEVYPAAHNDAHGSAQAVRDCFERRAILASRGEKHEKAGRASGRAFDSDRRVFTLGFVA